MRSDYVLRPYLFSFNAQAGLGFIRLNADFNLHFTGKDEDRGTWFHAYAGYQPLLDEPKAETRFMLSGVPSIGYKATDYMYDQWLGGRNATSGILAHQIFLKDAGFKTLAVPDLSSTWMMAAGISYALPLKIFHLYMDAAVYDSDLEEKTVLSYSGGVSLVILNDVLEIHLPLIESQDIRESIIYDQMDQWYKRICFQANIKLMNPMDVLDRVTLRY
jgi:hypothetical protein